MEDRNKQLVQRYRRDFMEHHFMAFNFRLYLHCSNSLKWQVMKKEQLHYFNGTNNGIFSLTSIYVKLAKKMNLKKRMILNLLVTASMHALRLKL